MDEKNLRAYFAELLGTFAVVFVSAGAVWASRLGGLEPLSVSIALAAGLIYAGALVVTLPISGGYLNPAMTLMLWVFKHLDGAKAVGLIFVQFLGAALAGFVLRLVFPLQESAMIVSRLGAPHINLEVFNGMTVGTTLKGIGVELVLTFFLGFVLYGLVFDPRVVQWMGKTRSRLTALWLGLVVAAVTFVGFPLTGGAANPARWFGPTLAETTVEPLRLLNPFADHAVYWIGPVAGALIAGWLYTALILPPVEESIPQKAQAGAVPAGASSTLFRAKR
jgi:glycerol uptake facilitator-like aquaporin